MTNLSKKHYRKIIKNACHLMNEARLRNMSENKKKCDRIMEDKYGKKDYILNQNINKARFSFNLKKLSACFTTDVPLWNELK